MPAGAPSGLDEESYGFLRDYIHRASGILLDDDKHYLLEARLRPIAEASQLGSLLALCRALRNDDPPLRKRVVEAMTTHETLFFRDAAPFEALKKVILPDLLERKPPSSRMRVWSAACSSGQEPYSLAIVLFEMGLELSDFQILATDLSEQILARARAGRFLQIEINRGLPVTHLVKYFERDGLDWRVKEPLRQAVRFEQFDLRDPVPGKGSFDLIFCRNVLIYFDIATKKDILARLRAALVPGGYLVLGSAESTLNLDETFKRIQVDRTTFYRAP